MFFDTKCAAGIGEYEVGIFLVYSRNLSSKALAIIGVYYFSVIISIILLLILVILIHGSRRTSNGCASVAIVMTVQAGRAHCISSMYDCIKTA